MSADVLCERPGSNTATALIRRYNIIRRLKARGVDSRIVHFCAVAAHARHVAVEEGRLCGVGGCAAPIPVLVFMVSNL
jgi:hypothetical protein